MTVRTHHLFTADSVVDLQITVWTVPAGFVAILKDIRVSSPDGSAERGVVYVDSGPIRLSLVDQALPAPGLASVQGFIVLAAGESVGMFSRGQRIRAWGSGSLLDVTVP